MSCETKTGDETFTPHWLIIGHGMVAMRLLQDLVREQAHSKTVAANITVISAEPKGGYNRIGLSDVLVGKRTLNSLDPVAPDWFTEHGIAVKHDAVVHIDRAARRVVLASGAELGYDRLILATGSSPRVPPIPGVGLQGVQAFRTRNDLQNMESLNAGSSAVVLGGGLLGLEAAVGLAAQGVDVTVVHRGEWLMNRQLDRQAGAWLAARLQQQGIHFITGAEASEIIPEAGDGRVAAVRLNNNVQIAASTVVLAIGIVPRDQLAEGCGLKVNGGVAVDDTLTTSDPHIHALGECASHRGVSYGLVAPLYEQARVLANRLLGGAAIYTGSSVSTQLKVSGVPVFSAGDIEERAGCHAQIWVDQAQQSYKKLLFEQNRLVGAVLYGDTTDGGFYHSLIAQKTDISAIRPWLTFGPQFCDLPSGESATQPATASLTERTDDPTVREAA